MTLAAAPFLWFNDLVAVPVFFMSGFLSRAKITIKLILMTPVLYLCACVKTLKNLISIL